MQHSFAGHAARSAIMIALAALAACNSPESEAPPAAEPTTVAVVEPSLAPPGRQEFTDAWAEACPSAETVSTALCKSKGLTDPNFACEFGLGKDEYRRNSAELTRGEGRWVLADAEQACKIGTDAG